MLSATILFAIFAVSTGHDRNISHLIEKINGQEGVLWKASKSKFDHWHPEDIRRMFGVNPSRIRFKQLQRAKLILASAAANLTQESTVPESFDSRTAWPKCATIRSIRDQGSCGSCWAMAAVEAMSDRICVASQGSVQTYLSAENLIACCASCGFGCYGGLPDQAWKYYGKHGIVSGGNYNSYQGCQPYSIQPCEHHTIGPFSPCGNIVSTPTCKSDCTNPYYSRGYADDFFFANSTSPQTACMEQDIQRAILTGGPVEAAFLVYEDFLNYKEGIYHHVTGSVGGGHAVKIVGWGVENGIKYWIVANSWNIDWGEDGFFKIKRGRDECGIESDVTYGFPDLEKSPAIRH
ncbi:hypothetical protein ACOME3_008146 [Neoechinorhynchus agilis]